MRLQQRSLRAETVIAGIESLEIVESYPEDKYMPSYLLRGESAGLVFHAQIAVDVDGDNVRVVTIYIPSAADWNSDFRLRRTQQ